MKTVFYLILIFVLQLAYAKSVQVKDMIVVNPYLKYKNSLKKLSVKRLIKVVSSSNDNINYKGVAFRKR